MHSGALAGYIVKRGGNIIQEYSDIAISKQIGMQLPPGNALATKAGSLPFKKIIHAVGPIWGEGGNDKIDQLKSAINNSLELSGVSALNSIAIPAISSGVFGFPSDLCAKCFMEQTLAYAEKKSN